MTERIFSSMPNLNDVDDALTRSVLILLFTDKRVETEDLPCQTDTNGGFWGDAVDLPDADALGTNYSWGSRLWLLERAKITTATAREIEEMITQALSPLVDCGVIQKTVVSVERVGVDALSFTVVLYQNNGKTTSLSFKNIGG